MLEEKRNKIIAQARELHPSHLQGFSDEDLKVTPSSPHQFVVIASTKGYDISVPVKIVFV